VGEVQVCSWASRGSTPGAGAGQHLWVLCGVGLQESSGGGEDLGWSCPVVMTTSQQKIEGQGPQPCDGLPTQKRGML
jgi:hypothetical protein